MPALPTIATLAYTAPATGGLSPAQLASLMGSVVLYDAPPEDAPFLPPGTSDAVFDVLFGAKIIGDDHGQVNVATGDVTRTITLGLRPAAGATGSSFVSLGNAVGVLGIPSSLTATTNNPPYPAPVPPSISNPAPPDSIWVGCVVSSNPNDSGAAGVFPGAVALQISFLDRNGNAGVETVILDGQTPVALAAGKYLITDVEIISSGVVAPIGQINLWSGPIDEITGYPTGIVVGYLPCGYFTNFSFQQLPGWTPAQLSDSTLAYALVPPDYNYPNQTVVATPPPRPSKSLLNYPPPSSVASLNPGATNDPLLTPQPNFSVPNRYLSLVAGVPSLVANPFQGLWLGAFGAALNMPISRAPQPGAVSMSVTFS